MGYEHPRVDLLSMLFEALAIPMLFEGLAIPMLFEGLAIPMLFEALASKFNSIALAILPKRFPSHRRRSCLLCEACAAYLIAVRGVFASYHYAIAFSDSRGEELK